MSDVITEPIAPDEALALADGDTERLRELLPGVVAHMRLMADEAGRDTGLEIADQLFDILEHTSDDKLRRDLIRRYAINAETQIRQLTLFIATWAPMNPETVELLSAYAVGVQ